MRFWRPSALTWRETWRERGPAGLLVRFFTPPRKLIPTKAGWIFFGFMLVIVVFAYATNNNLLFLLFAAMLAMMVLSGLMSEASLGELTVARRFPAEIFARRPFFAEYRFHNEARRLAAYAFHVHDPPLFGDRPPPYVVHLPAGGSETQRAQVALNRRGRVRLGDYELRTQYPFLLFTKTRAVRGGDELVVYPAVHPLDAAEEDLFGRGDGRERIRQGGGDAFSFVREYVEGEPLRKVDWKKSARGETLYLKEFDRSESRRVLVRLLFGEKDYQVEPGLETAASWLVWLAERGLPFALDAADGETPLFDRGAGHLRAGLARLALFATPGRSASPSEGADRVVEVYADGRFRIA
ncbi:MAG: DUF58 domain-containing protein [Myxococcales bacterium]|nr:MAG: DUF58 domain-containing protein [Myxococcales bacterium]